MEKQTWERLCLAIVKEADPNRLMQLVIKLNSTFEERETGLQGAHLNPPKSSPSEAKALIKE